MQRLLAVVSRTSLALRSLEGLCEGRAAVPAAFSDIPAMSKVFVVACARRLRMLNEKFHTL